MVLSEPGLEVSIKSAHDAYSIDLIFDED